MFPVLAEHEIQVIQQGRRERLAGAERGRLIRSQAASSATPAAGRRPLLSAWTALSGSVNTFFRVGHRPVETGGERAAVQS